MKKKNERERVGKMHPSEFDITISEEGKKIRLPLSSLLNLPTYSNIRKSVINIYPFLDALCKLVDPFW